MKKSNFKYIIFLLGVFLCGCKNYLDINKNPNAPTSAKPELILSGAIIETARIQSQDVVPFSSFWTGYWSASGSYSQSNDVVRTYNLRFTSFQGAWANLYSNAINYNYVESSSKSRPGYDYYVAVAKIMKVYDFHTLVDIYGDVPYKQSLGGFSNLQPSYDKAQTVYESLSNQLDSAANILLNAKNTTALDPAADIIFSGDTKKWAQLANTIRLKLLLRQSEMPGRLAYIQGEIAKIVANGAGFLGSGQNVVINSGYAKANGKQNPMWETNGLGVDGSTGGRDYNRSSSYALDFFNKNGDPRLPYLFLHTGLSPGDTSTKAGTYLGIDFGALPTTNISTGNTSGLGTGILSSPSQDEIFLSASESLFLQSEAAFRGWIAGDPQAFYESAITESFNLLKIPNAATTAKTYYTSGTKDADWSASSDKLEAIITQKWAANYSIDPMEAWCDLRRLKIPSTVPLSQDPSRIGGGLAPIRLLYPQTEYSYNSKNVGAVNGGAPIDQFTTKIFWQVK